MTSNTISFSAYDTICRISLPVENGSERDAASVLTGAQELAWSVERSLSMFDEDSELSTLCRYYVPNQPYSVSPLLFSFLKENLHIAVLSDGAFDPTVGALVKLWDFLSKTPSIPDTLLLEETLKQVGYSHVKLCEATSSVIFDCPDIALDPGAGGKGFALGLVENYLRENGVKSGTIDFGGNLYALGQKKVAGGKSRPWTVGIQNPEDQGRALGVVPLENRGIATSSWYEHFFKSNGELFHHLLDPKTGKPIPLAIKSVSVLSSRASYTDLLSTAFFVLGMEKGVKLLKHLSETEGIDLDFVAMLGDGTVHSSSGAGFIAS